MYHSGWARLFCRIQEYEKSQQFKTTFISQSRAYPWALLAHWLNHQGTQANRGFILTKTEAEKREQWENNGLALKASGQRWHRTSSHRLLAKASHMTEPDSNGVRMNNPSTEKDMEGREGWKRDSREGIYVNIQLIRFAVQWKLIQHCKAITFQFKNLGGKCRFLQALLLLSHFSRVRLCATPETASHQAPPSLGFSRQEHWSGLPFPSPMHETEKWT